MKANTADRRPRGHIQQRGQNRYLLRVFIGRDPNTGKRSYRSQTVNGSLSEAQKALTTLLYQLDHGQLLEDAERATVSAYLDHWLETAAKAKLAESTFEKYRQMMRDYVFPSIGGRRLARLSPMNIQGVYSELLSRGLSPRTVRYCHAVLSSALKQAVRWRLIPSNPASFTELPKQRQREMRALTSEQASHFLKVTAEDRYHAFFAVLLLTGVRASEARALTWADVDLPGRTIVIRRAVHDRPSGHVFSEPKTRRSRRSITIPEELVRTLLRHKSTHCGHGQGQNDLLFATATGKPDSHSNIYNRHFKPLARASALPEDFRMHDLRHTHASLLLQAGVHPKVVSERLGHASITLTLDTYSHVLPGLQEESAEKLNQLLFPPEQDRARHIPN